VGLQQGIATGETGFTALTSSNFDLAEADILGRLRDACLTPRPDIQPARFKADWVLPLIANPFLCSQHLGWQWQNALRLVSMNQLLSIGSSSGIFWRARRDSNS
jgi:hypothetical protein